MMWYGYPFGGDRLAASPWWYLEVLQTIDRSDGKHPVIWRWVRLADGVRVGPVTKDIEMEALAQVALIDHNEPLPRPPLLCGQVWVSTVTGMALMVTCVDPDPHKPRVKLGDRWHDQADFGEQFRLFVLAGGLGAPWAPTGAKEVPNDDG